jgi:HEAT repeat protein
VPALIEALTEDVNTYVRTAAAESLGHLGDERAIFPLMDALQDSCSFVRRAAAIALGQLHAKEAQVALLHALEDSNFYVRRAAINAIGKLGIPDLGKVLLPLLELDDARMRRTTVTALRRLGTQEAIPPMIEMLDAYLEAPAKRDLPVVKTLVVALGKMRAVEAVQVLTRVLRGYVGARSIAAKALGQIGDPAAVPALVEALNGQSAGLRLAALKSLRNLDDADAIAAVRELLMSPDPRLRREAAITVAQLGDEVAIPRLLEMAHGDPSPLARPAAVEALGYYDRADLIDELLPLVADSNAYVRAALAPTLGRLYRGSSAVRSALRTLASDKVRHVASTAQKTLEILPSRVEVERGNGGGLSTVAEKMPGWLQRLLHRG